MNALKRAYSLKEKADRLLSNLEKLGEEGSIAEEQYNVMKQDYASISERAASEVESIKSGLQEKLADKQRALEIYGQELKNLEVRFRVGELDAEKYRKAESRTRSQIRKIKEQINKLQSLTASQSSADVGGYMDVPLKRKSAKTSPLSGFADRVPAFAEMKGISLPTEWVFDADRIAAIAGAGLMFISVFLPWILMETTKGGIASVLGIQTPRGLGVLFVLLALANGGALFLANLKPKALGHVITGGCGVLGIIIGVIWFPSYLRNWGVARFAFSAMAPGVYLYFIGCVVSIVFGVRELKA